MARGIMYPKGWPGTQRIDRHAKALRRNLRAVNYINNINKDLKGLVPNTYITPDTEMSDYG